MGEKMDPWGPDREGNGRNGKELELELEWSWDPMTALAWHRNQEALNKKEALKEGAFKGQD